MEKEIIKLIEVLADKLGTTTIYLWKILVKQAFISGITDIIQYIIIIIATIWLTKFTKRKVKDDMEDYEIVITCAMWIVMALLLIIAFFSIGTTITAFTNPEYWALEQLTKK